MENIEFQLVIKGSGETIEEAYNDAIEKFKQDPDPSGKVLDVKSLKPHIVIRWHWQDIQQIRPEWSEDKCIEALNIIKDMFTKISIDTGWQVLEHTISMLEEKKPKPIKTSDDSDDDFGDDTTVKGSC